MKVAILAGVLAVLAGCTESQVNHAADGIASAAPALANDGLTIAKIEGRLVQIDPSSALHVAVTSNDGAVKLSGKVRSEAVSQKYVAAARAVGGVKNVTASLDVDPGLPNAKQQAGDFALMAAVRGNMAGQAGLNSLAVGVKAHAGTVTLTGKVKTAALRSTLAAAAKDTSGVKSVVDELKVAE
jgi:osmotically-inducible protein OsmY